MPRWGKRVLLAVVGLLVVALACLAVANAVETARRDQPYVADKLGPTEKAELTEVLSLKSSLGDEVWPGLAKADIPLILFNDRYEFLVGMSDPPAPWAAVEGDAFQGQTYFRRAATKPVAFAVPIGDRWAGSLGQLERMNREYLLGVRTELPPVAAQLFPYFFATLSRDMHVASFLHETFHAYEATIAPSKLARAEAAHSLEKSYPYGILQFEDAWNDEGRYLSAALGAPTDDAARQSARTFLDARRARRQAEGLSSTLVAYERDLEWEEGLAKHVEMKFHETAAAHGLAGYPPGLPYWQQELARVNGRLGEQGGDYRFYLSGMAQAVGNG